MDTMQRIKRLRERMEEENLDAFFVSSPENRLYLSGFTGSAGYLYVTPSSAILATDFRYIEQAGIQAPDYEIVRIAGSLEWLKAMLSSSSVRRVGIEGSNMTVNAYQAFADAVKQLDPTPQFVPTNAFIDQLREVKEPEELSIIEHAVYIADTAMESISAQIRPGITEREVAWKMEVAMRELGADSISFDTIVAAGPNGARPHHRASDYAVQKGDAIVIDMGAKYNGYCSDMTRTFILGKADETFRRVYDIVLTAQEAAEVNVRAGMTGGQADALARSIIEEAGYGETFGHSLGHGIGVMVHEFPRVGPNSTGVITDGMVFSVEPGIYITGWGGVRIEDLVVMENGFARVLNKAHKRDLIEL